ncbi:MAG: hypothetical protein AUH12_08385 [Gemmatimonadetes bacterium 13_2_20CM_69_8]|nr:MAG: hypothetical protein AUH12_08385 [Gemmatimonadetes bacterium 13_2_20CM_69_8]
MRNLSRQYRDPELSSQGIAGVAGERPARHVLDDSEARRAAVARGAQRAAHGLLGLRGRNRNGDDGWRLGQELRELREPLHPGRKIDEQHVQPAPRHVRQKLAQRRGLERAPPHEALGLGAVERERTAVLEEQCHREAADALRAHRRLDNPVVQRATGKVEMKQLRGGRAVQIRVQHAHRPARPGQGSCDAGRHEALAHPPFAAHHRHHPSDRCQPLCHTAPLRPDLAGQAGPVGFRQVVVSADIEWHASERWTCRPFSARELAA